MSNPLTFRLTCGERLVMEGYGEASVSVKQAMQQEMARRIVCHWRQCEDCKAMRRVQNRPKRRV